MRLPLLRLVSPAFLLLAPPVFGAPAADEAVEAVLNLRKQAGYSWEISTGKTGIESPSELPRTKHGAINAAGEIYLEQIWPSGLILETITTRDGTVIHTPDGWYTRAELENFSRQGRRGPRSTWLRFALASLENVMPEEELTRMLNDSKDHARTGENIDALLTERGATYWLGSARLIPNAAGHVHLRLRNGLIRECRISAEGEFSGGSKGDTTRYEFETTFLFDYTGGAFTIPHEARKKLKPETGEP